MKLFFFERVQLYVFFLTSPGGVANCFSIRLFFHKVILLSKDLSITWKVTVRTNIATENFYSMENFFFFDFFLLSFSTHSSFVYFWLKMFLLWWQYLQNFHLLVTLWIKESYQDQTNLRNCFQVIFKKCSIFLQTIGYFVPAKRFKQSLRFQTKTGIYPIKKFSTSKHYSIFSSVRLCLDTFPNLSLNQCENQLRNELHERDSKNFRQNMKQNSVLYLTFPGSIFFFEFLFFASIISYLKFSSTSLLVCFRFLPSVFEMLQ